MVDRRNMVEGETEDKVVWNFDDAESKLIFDMKVSFIKYRDAWDLENCYWALWRLLSESEALFEDNVKQEMNNNFKVITKMRNNTNKFSDLSEENKGICAETLNDLYREICKELVVKDYYFRKKKGYTGL